MFKIIIADDEPVIIRGLKKMINWERLSAEVIGEAANGEELLKKTEELSLILSSLMWLCQERQVWMLSAGSGRTAGR